MNHPEQLKAVLRHGLASFPLTDFDADLKFSPQRYAERLEWLLPYGTSSLFAAGGAGEFFSLTPDEYSKVIATAVATANGRTPIIAGTGYGTALAVQYAQEAERLGAHGLLLLPHYLTEASQQGLVEHIAAVCASVRLGVIIYNRGACRLTVESLIQLAERCPNLIGFKDGLGDIELMVSVQHALGDRLAYLCGLPTAELFAASYKAINCPVYSSAVFNFVPRTAMAFYNAHASGDTQTTSQLIREFFLPLVALRNKGAGYAVSLIKAGADIVGRSAGPVRLPLAPPKPEEIEQLRSLISRLGPQ